MPGYTFPGYPPPPLLRHGPPRRIAVLGAGMAGLVAADQLLQAGHQVVVLEASARPGGRVRTLRHGFSPGVHADAGAAFLPGSHSLTVGYSQALGLELIPMPSGTGADVDYLNGTLIPDPSSPNAVWPVKLRPDEQGLTPMQLSIKYIRDALVEVSQYDPRAPGWPPEALGRYDGLTYSGLLAAAGASPGAVSILRIGYPNFWGNGADTVAALLLLRDEMFIAAAGQAATGGEGAAGAHPASRRGRRMAATAPALPRTDPSTVSPTEVYRLRGGMEALPDALAARLGSVIQYESPVTAIHQADDGVQISLRTGATVTADQVVCTIPWSVLQGIPITPALPADKADAIRDMPWTSVTRVFLEFPTRYWYELGRSGNASTDLPATGTAAPGVWVEDATATQDTPHGVLDCYYTGPEAERLATLPAPDRIQAALDAVELLFPGARERFAGRGASWCWTTDPWALGGYCWFRPGQMARICPVVARPEGRLFFAGDHTSCLPGWIEGAVESGLRAADQANGAAA